MIRAVLFDFGGVVVSEGFQNWISDNIAPYETLKEEMMPMQDRVDRGTSPVSDYNDYLAKRSGKIPSEVEKEILKNYTLHTKVTDIIATLRAKGIKTAIVSNFPQKWFSHLRKQFAFDDLFDEILVSSELGLIKPEHAFFQEALRRTSVQPSEAVFVDDKKRYTDSAELMGIHGIVFESADHLKEQLRVLGLPL